MPDLFSLMILKASEKTIRYSVESCLNDIVFKIITFDLSGWLLSEGPVNMVNSTWMHLLKYICQMIEKEKPEEIYYQNGAERTLVLTKQKRTFWILSFLKY